MARVSGFGAMVRFHRRTGARVAWRNTVRTFFLLVVGIMFLRPEETVGLVRALFGGGGQPGFALAAVVLLGLAFETAPLVAGGASGWVRHLPVTASHQRRAATIAVMLTLTPLLLVFAPAVIVGAGLPAARALGIARLLVIAASVALFALPTEGQRASRGLLAASLGASIVGGWPGLAMATALLAGADMSAAGVRPPTLRGHRPSLLPTPASARIAWRALRWQLATAYGTALVLLLAATAFLVNNTLDPSHQRLGALLGGGAAVAFFVAVASDALARRRPPWPWARSLAASATDRVRNDALFLGLQALPLVALTGLIQPWSWLPLLPLTGLVAVRGAAAVRTAHHTLSGTAGTLVAEGLLLAGIVAIAPMAAVVALLLLYPALLGAARVDRELKTTRWHELHHLDASDPWATRT